MLTMSIIENCNETGRLHFEGARLRQLAPLNASIIDISTGVTSDRERVESFIEGIYAQIYGASLKVAYPILISIRDAEGDILAATGFRYARDEPLFLEHYTRAPIERALSSEYGMPISRDEIAEIGNLASGGGGASIFLFAAMAAYLNAKNIRYATITGTGFLKKRLKTLGLKPHFICDADPARLPPEEISCWGSYYNTRPSVLAGSVEDGICHLRKALGAVYEELPYPVYPCLHFREWT